MCSQLIAGKILFITELQNHTMADVGRGLGRSSGQHPPHRSSKATCSQLSSMVPRQFFNISKDGHPTASLGNLCQCLVTVKVKSVS